jgi:hypothetical protein
VKVINGIAFGVAGLVLVIGIFQGQGLSSLILVPVCIYWLVRGVLSAPAHLMRGLKGKRESGKTQAGIQQSNDW